MSIERGESMRLRNEERIEAERVAAPEAFSMMELDDVSQR
jgi:hypothetical protein